MEPEDLKEHHDYLTAMDEYLARWGEVGHDQKLREREVRNEISRLNALLNQTTKD